MWAFYSLYSYIMLNLYIQHLLLSVQSASKDRGEQSYEFYHLLILGHFREQNTEWISYVFSRLLKVMYIR